MDLIRWKTTLEQSDLSVLPPPQCTTREQNDKQPLKKQSNIIDKRDRLILLENMMNTSLKEIEYLKISLYARLDDWIIFSLKKENDVINQSLKEIK